MADATETFTPDGAGKFLGHSRPFIIKLIRKGELEATDERGPGSTQARYVITRAACLRWRESRRCQPVVETDEANDPLRRGTVTGLMSRLREKQSAKRTRPASARVR
jgi:hypothetical protein